jgi:hypothetical protein
MRVGSKVAASPRGDPIRNGQSYRQVWPAKEGRTDWRFAYVFGEGGNDPAKIASSRLRRRVLLQCSPYLSGAAAGGADAAGDAE